MLPNDAQIMLRPSQAPGPTLIDQSFSSTGSTLNLDFLNKIRAYLTAVQNLNYQLNEDIQKAVQEDFVQERRLRAGAFHEQQNGIDEQGEDGAGDNAAPGNRERARHGMSTDDLHAHLVLARLLGLSRGETTLTRDMWEETKRMERARKERVGHLPPQRNGPLAGGLPAGLQV